MSHKDILKGMAITFIVLLILAVIICATPAAGFEGGPVRTAKQDALHEAAEILRDAGYAEDSPEIQALSAAWWRQQEDLDIVARVVAGEAGNCPWKHKVAVAAVVVNRANSQYFADTVRDVVASPGQYTELYLTGFDQTPRECYEAAKVALDGTDDVPDDVIWQAEFVQGTSIWWRSEVDTGWFHSVTFFCRGVA